MIIPFYIYIALLMIASVCCSLAAAFLYFIHSTPFANCLLLSSILAFILLVFSIICYSFSLLFSHFSLEVVFLWLSYPSKLWSRLDFLLIDLKLTPEPKHLSGCRQMNSTFSPLHFWDPWFLPKVSWFWRNFRLFPFCKSSFNILLKLIFPQPIFPFPQSGWSLACTLTWLSIFL